MDSYLVPAAAFGTALLHNEAAAQFYDNCTPAQRRAILLQVGQVKDMETFVRDLPKAVL